MKRNFLWQAKTNLFQLFSQCFQKVSEFHRAFFGLKLQWVSFLAKRKSLPPLLGPSIPKFSTRSQYMIGFLSLVLMDR